MLHSSTTVSHAFSSQRFDEESALELGFVVEDDDDLEDLATRSPVVRIPTHHLDPSTHILFSAGQYHWACRSRQTSLLDVSGLPNSLLLSHSPPIQAIQSTDVIAGEPGGITQHIAAYQVILLLSLTLLDTQPLPTRESVVLILLTLSFM